MLENFDLLKNLSPEMLAEVEESCELKIYRSGEYLVREGDRTNEIYFLMSGRVDLYKIDPNTGNNLKFKEQYAGDSLGEMSFVDDSLRSCSVKAAVDTEVYVLSKKILFIKNHIHAEQILNHFHQNISGQLSNRMRYLTDGYITKYQLQIQALEERNYYGILFMFAGFYTGLTSLSYVLLEEFFSIDQLDITVGSVIFLLILLLPSVWIIRKFNIPLNKFGITRKYLKKSIIDGIIFSIVGLFGIMLIAWGIDFFSPNGQALKSVLNPLMTLQLSSSDALIYWPHSYAQEFIFRGLMLISVQEFLSDKKGTISILYSAFFFGINHAPLGFWAIIGTFIGGIVLGAIFLRTRNLAGVTIMHYIFGYVLVS